MRPCDVAPPRVVAVDEHVIEVRGLVKRYPDITAVDGIDFDVSRGQVFPLPGPSGAGKTTTVEILEGLRDPTAGEARVLGQDVRSGYRRIRERVGVLPQDFEPFDRLRPREAVTYWARLFDHDVSEEAVASIIETVGLSNRADTFALNLSGGEKRRLATAMALVGPPDHPSLRAPPTRHGRGPPWRRRLRARPDGRPGPPDARETGLDRDPLDGDLHEALDLGRRVSQTRWRADGRGGARRVKRILADVTAFARQYLRSRVGTFFALAFPVILILLFGAIFSSSGSPRVSLAVQDMDRTDASRGFV